MTVPTSKSWHHGMMLASVAGLLIVAFLALANLDTGMASQSDGSSGGQMPQEEWNRTFGGSNDDVGTYVQQTNDGGYVITGYTSSYYSADAPYSWLKNVQFSGDLWLIKTDPEGNKEWDRTFGGIGKDLGFCGQQTNDGGFIITGGLKAITGGQKSFWVLSNYAVPLIKTDTHGNEKWIKTVGGSGEEVGFSTQQTNDGGYIIAGYTTIPAKDHIPLPLSIFTEGKRAWLIKTDPNGNREWDVVLGRKDTEAASVQQTTDGGYILTGYTSSFGAGKEDVVLAKTDSRGAVEWVNNFGGPNRDLGLSVNETKDGGYIITGLTESFGDENRNGNIWLIKTTSKGIKEWDRTFGGPNFDFGASVHETRDGGYIITGHTSYSETNVVWLIKTDSKGIKEWDIPFNRSGTAWGNCVQETQDSGYIITGGIESDGTGMDVWLIKVK